MFPRGYARTVLAVLAITCLQSTFSVGGTTHTSWKQLLPCAHVWPLALTSGIIAPARTSAQRCDGDEHLGSMDSTASSDLESTNGVKMEPTVSPSNPPASVNHNGGATLLSASVRTKGTTSHIQEVQSDQADKQTTSTVPHDHSTDTRLRTHFAALHALSTAGFGRQDIDVADRAALELDAAALTGVVGVSQLQPNSSFSCS